MERINGFNKLDAQNKKGGMLSKTLKIGLVLATIGSAIFALDKCSIILNEKKELPDNCHIVSRGGKEITKVFMKDAKGQLGDTDMFGKYGYCDFDKKVIKEPNHLGITFDGPEKKKGEEWFKIEENFVIRMGVSNSNPNQLSNPDGLINKLKQKLDSLKIF